jgi:hypothetical protein
MKGLTSKYRNGVWIKLTIVNSTTWQRNILFLSFECNRLKSSRKMIDCFFLVWSSNEYPLKLNDNKWPVTSKLYKCNLNGLAQVPMYDSNNSAMCPITTGHLCTRGQEKLYSFFYSCGRRLPDSTFRLPKLLPRTVVAKTAIVCKCWTPSPGTDVMIF